jgi:hypothetical protein
MPNLRENITVKKNCTNLKHQLPDWGLCRTGSHFAIAVQDESF